MEKDKTIELENEENVLGQDFTIITLIQFALPTIIMMIFMGLYTIVDTIFVSRFVNTNALSAMNIVCPINNLIVGLGTMIATGGNAIVARKMGEGANKRACQDFSLLIMTGTILGIVITIFGVAFINQIILALGASELLFAYCKEYLIILLLFAPANIFQVLFQNLIITAGKPGLGLVLSLSAGGINVILDYLFIVILHMGIKGAALGTGIGYLFPTIIGILFFSQKRSSLYFCKPIYELKIIKESCTNGASEMVSQLAAAVTTFLFNITMMKILGEDGVAAVTIMIYTQFLLTTLYIGFSMGVAPIISYNFGGRNIKKLRKVMKICLLFISFISVCIFVVTLTFNSLLIELFSPKGTPVYEVTENGFEIFSFSFLLSGFNIFSSSLFTALSNGKISAMISFLRTFCFILICLLILPKMIGVIGVWLAVPIAEFITMFVCIICIYKYRKQYQYF